MPFFGYILNPRMVEYENNKLSLPPSNKSFGNM